MATYWLAAWGVLRRVLMLSLLWWILTGGAPGSWSVGAPAIVVAALLSIRLVPHSQLSVTQLLLFLPLFLLRSVLAAFDVARRTLAPRQDVDPGVVDFETRLPEGLARVFFMNTVSLLPGTLSATHDDGRLRVHVLDCRQHHVSELAALEARIGRIFPGSLHV